MPRLPSLRVGLALSASLLTAAMASGLAREPSNQPGAPPFQPVLLTPTGPEAVLLIASAGAARVVWGDSGRQESVALPKDGRLSRFETSGGEWIAAGTQAREKGREILVVASRNGSSERLPPPPGGQGALRHDPVPLVSGGRLVGLAWLQGDSLDRLGVWAAAWDGASWHGLQEVASPGPGSQLALTGAVLDEGGWLLAWSRFDGTADAIYWSLRRQEAWSDPRRVAAENDVPDIRPALVATRGGALLAWSHWDGQSYRLLLGHWSGARWSEPIEIGGPGSLYPHWRRSEAGAQVLYRQAAPGSWELLEVDPQGRLLRRASARAPAGAQPALASPTAPSLLFPDGRTETLSWWPVLHP